MKRIGSSFGAELIAAGCRTDGLAWGEDGDIVFHGDDWTQAERDAVNVVYAAHDPEASDAAEEAAAQRAAVDRAEAEAAKRDAQVMSFLNMTPAQRTNWITNNVSGPSVTNLAQLKTGLDTALNVLATMAAHGARGRGLRD